MPETKCDFSIFCEDVRNESGGKISIMGLLGDELLFNILPYKILKFMLVQCWSNIDKGKFNLVATFPQKEKEEKVIKKTQDVDKIHRLYSGFEFNNIELHPGKIQIETVYIPDRGKQIVINDTFEIKKK